MPMGRSLKNLPMSCGILILMCLLIPGCIERISSNTKRGGNQLVIEGKITNGNGPYTVKIGRTSNNERVMEPVDGAHVVVFDDSAKTREVFNSDGKGTYTAAGRYVKGQPGHAYHIEVTFGDGSMYRSRPEIMPVNTTSDSSYYKLATDTTLNQYGIPVKQKVIRVYVNTQIPQTAKNVYLRWYIDEVYIFRQYHPGGPMPPPYVYCYVTAYPNPQQILLYDGEGNKKTAIKNQLMATRPVDYTFYYRHFFNVHVVSLTREAYLYWKHVNEVVNSNGTIFDVPPATVIGNIYNPGNKNETVLGYFEAASVDTTRCSLYRSDLPYYIEDPCPTPDSHLGCASCLRINNSSLTEPYYFK